MKRIATLSMVALWVVVGFSATALGCTFYFNYERVDAPLGAVGEIGIQVQKTHNRCTLPSMESYEIVGEGIQILERSEWVEVGQNLYELWVRVSLAEVGDGALTISKDCSKEGEESGRLPIAVAAPTEDGAWATALAGVYPFEAENVDWVTGVAEVDGTWLSIGDLSIELPEPVEGVAGSEVGLFYLSGDTATPLLIVSESVFLRFDHWLETSG